MIHVTPFFYVDATKEITLAGLFQYKQLEIKEDWKKNQDSTEFEPMTSGFDTGAMFLFSLREVRWYELNEMIHVRTADLD